MADTTGYVTFTNVGLNGPGGVGYFSHTTLFIDYTTGAVTIPRRPSRHSDFHHRRPGDLHLQRRRLAGGADPPRQRKLRSACGLVRWLWRFPGSRGRLVWHLTDLVFRRRLSVGCGLWKPVERGAQPQHGLADGLLRRGDADPHACGRRGGRDAEGPATSSSRRPARCARSSGWAIATSISAARPTRALASRSGSPPTPSARPAVAGPLSLGRPFGLRRSSRRSVHPRRLSRQRRRPSPRSKSRRSATGMSSSTATTSSSPTTCRRRAIWRWPTAAPSRRCAACFRANLDEFKRTHADFCRPVVTEGPVLGFVRQRLAARAEEIGWTRSLDADLHLVADGAIVRPRDRKRRRDLRFPGAAQRTCGSCRSTFLPAMVGTGSNDPRTLGVMLCDLAIGGKPVSLDDERLREGVHQFELHAGEQRRWTDGALVLDPTFLGRPDRRGVAGCDLRRHHAPRLGPPRDGAQADAGRPAEAPRGRLTDWPGSPAAPEAAGSAHWR